MTAGDVFDPLEDLLVAQPERPANLGAVNLRTLTPFQRSLLVIDGTVTKFIEAYTMEPVETVRISQETRRLDSDHRWLDEPAGATLLARQVFLQGRYSGTLYAYAASLLARSRLSQAVLEGLETNPGGIGRVMLETGLETIRELLWYGREHVDRPPAPIDRLSSGDFISRTYRIIAGGRPLMLINEKFPIPTDSLPSHH